MLTPDELALAESALSFRFSTQYIGDPELLHEALVNSCPTCGWHYLQAGELCPTCKERAAYRNRVAAQALREFVELQHRGVHIFGIGLIDPWSEEGQRYLDD